MIKRINRVALIAVLALISFSVDAQPGYVYVDDMSKVKYQLVSSGRVYFRNLNEFNTSVANTSATGCCYAYYIDTTTPFGKSAWSVILMKMASASPLYLYVTDLSAPTSGSPALIDHLGNW